LSTAGVIRVGDDDGDRLADFVVFGPHNFDVPVRVGRNLAAPPGTAPQRRAAFRVFEGTAVRERSTPDQAS
jgi:hypothetical protein